MFYKPFMKASLLALSLLFYFSSIFGQNTDDSKYQLPKSIFNSNLYKRNVYQKFNGGIETTEDGLYKFGDKTLKIDIEDPVLLEVFLKGIFNPEVIFGKETTHKTNTELDTLSQDKKTLYNLNRNDSLAICCFEWLDKLNPNPQTKRFKLWVIRIGIANPTEYYLELYNDKATVETTLRDFIDNSIMTFYYRGTLII